MQLASWQLRSNYPKMSVRPSVWSLKYPLLTCTWVRWSTWPTLTVLRHVRPERFPGICRRTHGGNGLKFYMLMYLDHLQNWLVYGHSLLIFLILALFWLSETGQIGGFRAFPGGRMEEMAWNFARWCILTTLVNKTFFLGQQSYSGSSLLIVSCVIHVCRVRPKNYTHGLCFVMVLC